MSTYLNNIVKISEQGYRTLEGGGTVKGHSYDPSSLYLVEHDFDLYVKRSELEAAQLRLNLYSEYVDDSEKYAQINTGKSFISLDTNIGDDNKGYVSISGDYINISAKDSLFINGKKPATVNDIPNVHDWALAATKPAYTASEVGAAPAVHKHVKADITDFPTLSTVATSGSYNDLTNKPTIPTIPTLATVATSGSYNDLSNKPSIPTNTNLLTNGAGFLTNTSELGEAYLIWGGRAIKGGTSSTANAISPSDAGCIDEFGHNKLAYLPPKYIDVEYTIDGGETWIDYELSDASKTALVTTTGTTVAIGKGLYSTLDGTMTDDNYRDLKARITLKAVHEDGSLGIYTKARKLLLNASTQGGNPQKVHIECMKIQHLVNLQDVWQDFGTYEVGGWSDWNSIPLSITFGGSLTQTSQYAQIRITTYIEGITKQSYANNKACIYDIRLIGTTNWKMPSELARAGHLYTIDVNKVATFPSRVCASSFYKSGGTASQFLKADGSVDSNTYIKQSDVAQYGVISQKQNFTNTSSTTTNYSYTISNIQKGYIENSFIDMVEARGAVFNKTTGYFELNGLTDISYKEMINIWTDTFDFIPNANITGRYNGTIRTNFPPTGFTSLYYNRMQANQAMNNATLEVVNLQPIEAASTAYMNHWRFANTGGGYFLQGSTKLKKVIGVMNVSELAAKQCPISTTPALEEAWIYNVKNHIWLIWGRFFKAECYQYLLDNAINTSPIQIKLSQAAYDVVTTKQGDDWDNVRNTASSKNITFVTEFT